MKPDAPVPEGSDIVAAVDDVGCHVVRCPPRQRGRNAAFALAGLGAGVLLGLVSAGGLAEGASHPSWGAQLFLWGWLGPLAVISVLLIIRGAMTLGRTWRTDVLIWDDSIVRHIAETPWATRHVLDVATDRLDPLDPPTASDTPELSDRAARDEFKSPLFLRYRPEGTDKATIHLCMASLSYDEHHWLASLLNPSLASGAPPDKGPVSGSEATEDE